MPNQKPKRTERRAAEKVLRAALAKAQASSAGTKTTKAKHTATNVIQDLEMKGEEITKDAFQYSDIIENRKCTGKYGKDHRNAFMCSLYKLQTTGEQGI
ncbi:hypothetical protein scyTo_0007564 [Scyliorhinus torazame]|uniref:Uncharacterized protein n=1 Tax=Scyliorhinus torazame TaxID=75743 RepID=A0A401NUS5_SCYTO|nr:hypothetical protein [Scyliorhinus torazame]